MNRIFFVLVLIVFLSSCKKDKASELVTEVVDDTSQSYCDTVTVSFSSQIQPIFNQNCSTSGCHSATSASSGYVFENYSQISSNSLTAALKTIKHDPNFSQMPKQQPKLNDSLIEQIECWIAQGKLNN